MLLYCFVAGVLIALPLAIVKVFGDVRRAYRERRLGWGVYYFVAMIVILAFAI